MTECEEEGGGGGGGTRENEEEKNKKGGIRSARGWRSHCDPSSDEDFK